jgi:trk system potassium uptake protein TrkA
MKIVVAGAGDIGFHLAELLSYEQQAITLIDTNNDVLDHAQQKLDVITLKGDASTPSILDMAEVGSASIFLAVTTSEKTNLISCILAKKMGASQCIARVNNVEYLDEERRNTFKELGVDAIFSPRLLASQEIVRLIKHPYFTDVFEFEKGKFYLCGLSISHPSKLIDRTIEEIARDNPDIAFRPIAILRDNTTIITRGQTVVRENDHMYFLIPRKRMDEMLQFLDKKKGKKVQNIMVVGGTDVGFLTAQLLENDYNVKLIEEEKTICKRVAENLEETLVLHGNPTNLDLLRQEGMGDMDCFISLTPRTESNILSCLMARESGVYKTIALVENIDYTHLSQNIGIDTLINKKLIAANNIFRFVRKGKVEAITSLHGVDAEVIEFLLHRKNRVTKKPIKDLHFPEKALIGGVIREGKTIIPDGNFIMSVGDKVIVFALPEAISRIEELFR